GRPDEHDKLAVFDREAEVAHRGDRAVRLDQIDQIDARHAYLRTMPKLKPRARCLRIRMPTIINGRVMPTDNAACRPNSRPSVEPSNFESWTGNVTTCVLDRIRASR